MVRCLGAFLLNGGSSFFSDVCDCQSHELYAADDDCQQQGVDDQQNQAYCVEYTGYKCVFCHAFCPPFPHNMVFPSAGIVPCVLQILFLCSTGTFVDQGFLVLESAGCFFDVMLLF